MAYFSKLVVICGPTATGKTKLGVAMAKKFNGEIISADSRQVYLGNDVLTGKDKEAYAGVPVWGLDLMASGGSFNVAAFVNYARTAIADITSRGKLPIVVGGTGLYIKALLEPFQTIDIPPDAKLREQNLAVDKLQKELQKIDPEKWRLMNVSDQQNPRRLTRAIEISLYTKDCGRSSEGATRNYDVLVIGLMGSREVINEKIAQRRKQRPELIKKEQSIAKKQLAYFRKYFSRAVWFDVSDRELVQKIDKMVEDYLNRGDNRHG